MHKFATLVFSASCLALFSLAVGCSSNSKNPGGGGNQSGLQFTGPSASPTIELGQTITVTVNEGVTWSLENGGLVGKPGGQLTKETATSAMYVAPPALTPPPACIGTAPPPPQQQVTIVATSTADTTQSAALPVFIDQAPPCVATAPTFLTCPTTGSLIPPLTNQVFQSGVFQQITVGDGGGQNLTPFGVPPFTWSVASGSLPNGLVLAPAPDGSSALIQGTPATSGCSSATLQITDATGISSTQAFAFVVVPPALSVQVPSYADAYVDLSTNVGVPYAPSALVVSNGTPPYSWAYNANSNGAPNFPEGLCLSSSISNVPIGCTNNHPPASSNIGFVWGTPTATDLADEQNNGGPFLVQLQVSDSQTPYPALALPNVSMTVYPLQASCPGAPDIQPSTINGGVSGGGSVPANAYLQGSFAFLARGFDADGPVAIAGSVTTDGSGGITGGVEDITRSGGSQSLTILSQGSSYSVGGTLRISALGGPSAIYNRGCLTLANSAGTKTTFAFGLGGCSNNYTESGLVSTHDNACGMKQNGNGQNVAAGTYTTGRIIEFDDLGAGTRGTGFIRSQDSSSFSNSGFNGLYAFGLSGQDSKSGHYAIAGSAQASSGTLSSAAADIDDAGTLSTQLTGGSGTYNIDSNGRGTATVTIGQSSFDFALYMVTGNEVILTTTDSLDANHPIIAGEAIKTSGPYSFASLQNSHMFHISGLSPVGPDVSIGVLNFDGIGGVTGTVYQDQGGTLGSTTVSADYMVDSNTGRATFLSPNTNQPLGAHSFVAYLIPPPAGLTNANCRQPASCVTGFLVGTDSTAEDGTLEFQTSSIAPPPPFSNTNVTGDYYYGTAEGIDTTTSYIEGSLSSDGSSLNSRTQDASYGSNNYCLQPGCVLLFPNETRSSASFKVNADGTGTSGGETVSITNGSVTFYIDESPLNLHPSVIVAEQ